MPTSMPVVPPAVSVTVPDAVAVAGWLIVTVVPAIAVMTEPSGRPGPAIGMPTVRPVLLATTRAEEPAVVDAEASDTLVVVTVGEPLVVEEEPTLNWPEPRT